MQVKSQFTRLYNKAGPVLPFATHTTVTKKKGTSQDDLYGEEDDYVESGAEDDDDDIEKDTLIKVCICDVCKVTCFVIV